MNKMELSFTFQYIKSLVPNMTLDIVTHKTVNDGYNQRLMMAFIMQPPLTYGPLHITLCI